MEKREVDCCVNCPLFDGEWYVCQGVEGEPRSIKCVVCPSETTPIPDWCPARRGVLVVLK